MISWPTYENNRMARFIPAYYYNQLVNDPTNPLLNHALGDVLPAGSVFKITTGVGALPLSYTPCGQSSTQSPHSLQAA